MVRLHPIFDHHSHPTLYAALHGCPTLEGCRDEEEALRLLRALPEDRLSLVLGWHGGRLPLPPGLLALLPPALIVNRSLHAFRLTAAAARMVEPADPELVERHADPAWSERNFGRLLALFGRSAGLTAGKLERWIRSVEAVGVGAAEEMHLPGAEAWQVLRRSRWASRLPWWTSPAVFASLPPEAQAECQGLKLFADGALGARTAALSEPFLDGSPGLLLHGDAELEERLAGLHPWKKPLAIHAIGDLAIGQVLGALERVDRQGLRFPAVRIEHAQFATEAQARRARDLAVVLSMQPCFTADSLDYADRLAPAWLARNNPFRMLVDRCGFRPGVDLLLGSDGMPHGLEAAARWSLSPPHPGQRLALEELLAGHGVHPEAAGEWWGGFEAPGSAPAR